MPLPVAFTIMMNAAYAMNGTTLLIIALPVAIVGGLLADLLYGLLKQICSR